RSGVITDAEIIELRYSGRPASALRLIKALYFGLFINCLTMAWVIAAMVKISRAFFVVDPLVVISVCVVVSVSYTLMGGFRSVVVTDLVQFALSAGGAILLAVLVMMSFAGLGKIGVEASDSSGLLGSVSEVIEMNGDRSLSDVFDLVPPKDHPTLPPVFLLTLLIAGWWRWAEGTGYFVQRMAACRNEAHAEGAMIWFAVVHNSFRPWPWILVGLASLVLFPGIPGTPPAELTAEVSNSPAAVASVRVAPAVLDLGTGGALRFQGLPQGCQAELAGQSTGIHGSSKNERIATFESFDKTGVFPLLIDCPGQHFQARLEG
ncbi:MAG: hypothetical protein P8Y44_08870, partial [Acidobacteriota bacterium]